ncbi:thioredoxin fold domain-containing protein [Acidithiobacillus thiooxidans]|uniref:thioredoxin fold domain-containing protein n=1 Tax=Acidithiobacillus thiooxidans TaxID=930 RepID=UPI001C0650BF|nr:thioredoxin fold domain-containing protein [Acidithiobacillus thiooxidans]MBU2750107.1 thioredoxin fold domain-containing protein [Acidithiobacillus thiooxidans]
MNKARLFNIPGRISIAVSLGLTFFLSPSAIAAMPPQSSFDHIEHSFHLPPKALPIQTIVQKLRHADTFLVGRRGPELTAFMDPNCIWCHRFYEKAMPLVRAGKLHLRVALVGFLKPTSAAKAAAILAAKNPAQALAIDESHFNVTTEEGGIRPDYQAPLSIRRAVSDNTQLLAQTGEEATPTLLYYTKTKQWHLQHGLGLHGLHNILATIA